jgi:capsular exopolysaccharide synthesis family protein
MSINDAVRIIRERARIVLLCFLLGLLGAGVAVVLIPRQYSADVPVYVTVSGRSENSDAAYQANQLAKDKVTSYTPLMRDERVLQAVVDKLRLPMTAQQLGKRLTVTVQPDSAVMQVSVTDNTPAGAVAIADAVANEFVGLVSQFEQPFGPAPAPVPALTPTARLQQQPAADQTQIKPRIIRQAIASPNPVSPNVPFGVALGAALGLLVGIGAAFAKNAGDSSVRDPARLRVLTSAPVLAVIPADRGTKALPIALDDPRESPRAEAYRRLRTNLQFHHGAPQSSGAKVVVVSSAGIGDGTSVTACNLARALASGSRTLLIDANLRHPQIDTYLALEPGPGLTTVLTGNVSWPFARRKLADVALEVLPSGPSAPRMGELLNWQRMDELLLELRRRYDFVIIDAPALLPVSDAAAVAARADGVLLVVRYGVTTEEQVVAALDALNTVSAPLVGTVLNRVPPHRSRKSEVYAEQPSSHLPVLLGPGVNPLVPPDRRIPVESDGLPDGLDGFDADPSNGRAGPDTAVR